MSDSTSETAGRRVAIVGIGAARGLGWGREHLAAGLARGEAAIGDFTRFDHTQHRTHVASQAPEPPLEMRGGKRLSIADRFALFSVAEALDQAGLPHDLAGLDVGVYFGSSTGGMWEGEEFFHDLLQLDGRHRRVRASLLASQQVNGPGDAVARRFRVEGPVETVSSACASGGLALGAALEAIRSGEVQIAIAGGADSLCRITYAGFNALRSVSETPCRPFRAEREGLSIGEGGAVLVLENEERALARGARPIAWLAGAGGSCDAHHMTAPEPRGTGAAAAIRLALADAGLAPDAIDFVNAHGTGTALNDAAEWNALATVFGERAAHIPVTSTKGLIGHLLGSSGSIEAAATALGLARGEVHPTPGGGDVDPELGVDLVVGALRSVPHARYALSTSLAFGGANAAVVLEKA